MKRIAIVLSLAGAIVTGAWACWLLRPDGAYAQYYKSHEVLEHLAFGSDGSTELKKAVTDQRLAMKSVSISRGLARGLIGSSVLFVGLAVLLSVTSSPAKKEPIQQLQQQRP
ncbi:MAG: hypothetical protein PSV13_11795 [Lacunisphaera sp.]|nr:hypothetical protein [Lacunisphaera sp.]